MTLRWLLIGLCLILFSLILPHNLIVRAEPNTATTYYVTGTNDPTPGACTVRSGGGGYDCPSLRSAVIAANANPGWDTILLKHNTTYQLTIPMTSTDFPATGDLDITQQVTFGFADVCLADCGATLQGGPSFNDRVLQVAAGIRVDLKQVTLRYGNTSSAPLQYGGGIYNAGILTLTHSTVYSNATYSLGGGIYNHTGAVLTLIDSTVYSNAASAGGGLYSDGTAYLNDSVFEKNIAANSAGGIFNQLHGHLVMQSGFISGNLRYKPGCIDLDCIGSGGGLVNVGWLIMTDTQIVNNWSQDSCGGLCLWEDAVAYLTRVNIERNHAGENNNTVGSYGGLLISLGQLTLDQVTIVSNTAGYVGGMIVYGALTMTHSRIQGNVASEYDMGGLYVGPGTPATIRDSLFLSNTAAGDGGGIYNKGSLLLTGSTLSGNQGRDGGGLYNESSAGLLNNTISGNRATRDGGGIFSTNAAVNRVVNNAPLRNNTFSSNQATRAGGGIFSTNAAYNLMLNNVTLVNNRSDADANASGEGGGLRVITGTAYVFNTLIAQNSDLGTLNRPDCSGALTLATYNLIQNPTGCTLPGSATGNITGQSAQIGPLMDHGGATWTHALLPNSPALNTGRPFASGIVLNNCLSTDQRGVARPIGPRCDIGAFEAMLVYLPLVVR